MVRQSNNMHAHMIAKQQFIIFCVSPILGCSSWRSSPLSVHSARFARHRMWNISNITNYYYYTRPPFRCAARACADAVRPAALRYIARYCVYIRELCLRPNPCGIECTDCTAQYTLPEMGGSIEPPEPPLATGLFTCYQLPRLQRWSPFLVPWSYHRKHWGYTKKMRHRPMSCGNLIQVSHTVHTVSVGYSNAMESSTTSAVASVKWYFSTLPSNMPCPPCSSTQRKRCHPWLQTSLQAVEEWDMVDLNIIHWRTGEYWWPSSVSSLALSWRQRRRTSPHQIPSHSRCNSSKRRVL